MRQQGLQPPAPAPQAIPRRSPAEAQLCPPSIDQERLWFIDQLQPASAAYNIYTASRIVGKLDVPLLERVVNELIKRHEALRTTFTDVDGQPMQRIAPALEISLAPVDLQTLPAAAREREALRLTTEDFARPFDLARGPLVRVGLLRLDEAEHVLYVNMHHAITDRWSFAIFEQELAALYQAFATGQPSPLAEPPIQFGDYAVWQRARMQGAAYRQQLAYWQEKLAGAPPVLEVPPDYARPALQTFRGGHVPVVLPKHLLDALKALGQSEGATMHMTLMAAYKTLLHRYTGETDLLVAASIANRDRPETQGLFGYLLNLLVLRTDLAGR
ncbi:MAG TPA: condensation domain-containing protein, partial [Pyrinomonadaceae bacterium]|nr:condensation domain-containing protein [Pyrinomonadaceae bacterium]